MSGDETNQFDVSDFADTCDCEFCISEREKIEQNDATVPTDAELDMILTDLTNLKVVHVDSPEDLDAVFAQLFGSDEQAPEEEDDDHPFGPVYFTEKEVKTIQQALRFTGTFLAEKVVSIVRPENDDVLNLMPLSAQAALAGLLEEALDQSQENKNLYDWFYDEFGIK